MVSILSGRVRDLEKDDWRKLLLLLDYLKTKINDHLILCIYQGVHIVGWLIDASFVVREDFRSHTGGLMHISKSGGLVGSSSKQQINRRIPTEFKLGAVDELTTNVSWVDIFWRARTSP